MRRFEADYRVRSPLRVGARPERASFAGDGRPGELRRFEFELAGSRT
jgi:hypothetical protein